jgi:hypothetical protein
MSFNHRGAMKSALTIASEAMLNLSLVPALVKNEAAQSADFHNLWSYTHSLHAGEI